MTGTTRVPARGLELQAAGVTPAVVDVFDAAALRDAGLAARPDVIVHQLTDLPRGLPPERLVTSTPESAGLVLRYGRLYGPGTGADAPGEAPTVHVDSAAVLALARGGAGAYNVVDDGSPISNLKTRRELAWDPAFRL